MVQEEWISRNVFVQNSKWAPKEPLLPSLRKEVKQSPSLAGQKDLLRIIRYVLNQ